MSRPCRMKRYVELPMVQKTNQSPGKWPELHSKEKKRKLHALIGAAKDEMKKIFGIYRPQSFHQDEVRRGHS